MFKKQNGKRRWRRILRLEGDHRQKEIKWYADFDRELQQSYYDTGGRNWKYNVDWRQNSSAFMNDWRLFDTRPHQPRYNRLWVHKNKVTEVPKSDMMLTLDKSPEGLDRTIYFAKLPLL